LIFRPNDLTFEANLCLRAASSFNKCEDCVHICPQNALEINRDRVKFDADKCVSCGVCIGVCKPDAFSLNSFNIPVFIVWLSEQKKDKKLSCEEIGVCLAVFKADHLSALSLRANDEVVLDLSKCDKCEINQTGAVKLAIQNVAYDSNKLLKSFNKYISVETKVKEDRRSFLKKIHSSGESVLQNFSSEIRRPATRLLALSIKESNESEVKSVKIIDANLCTNCNDCATFCPTNALEAVNDGLSILHRPSECIACGICIGVCPSSAISSKQASIDDWLRSRLLVTFETKVCTDCKTLFSTAVKAEKCDGCGVFKEAFPDMFKTAAELS
jgi:ferredoxin